MATDSPRSYVPLTCHGHSRPVPHFSFSNLEKDGQYFMISACKGEQSTLPALRARQTLTSLPDGNPMLRDGINGDWYRS